MKKRNYLYQSFSKLSLLFLIAIVSITCSDDPDNYASRNVYDLKLTASTNEVVLNENTPDEVALSLEWTPAKDLGYDYIMTYVYEADLGVAKPTGSKDGIKEYEDDNIFKRSYTHKQLQEMLVDDWLQLTSTKTSMSFTVTATYGGPSVVVPDISSVSVNIKTYGAKQFLADKLYMSGTAVGDTDMEMTPSKSNAKIYVFTGAFSAGKINFPITYGDEVKDNAISPLSASQVITDLPMDAVVLDKNTAGSWVIEEAGDYRVTVNLVSKTVTIIPAGEILDFEKIYLSGTALDTEIEIAQTLEDENIYAFRGDLKVGTLYLPMLFEEAKNQAIVPNAIGATDINDGVEVGFSVSTVANAASTSHWNIKTAGTYRIVVNVDTKTITIYSPTTDLKNTSVDWNNTVDGINPYRTEVVKLWMYGAFNNYQGDGQGKNETAGFDDKYTLVQSLADPNVFVYKGDVLPRKSVADNYGKTDFYTGAVNFTLSRIHNNVYAYGSTADAVRNSYKGYTSTSLGATQTLVAGQANNRYAYFLIPENTNYVMVNIKTLQVVFDNK